LKNWIFAYLKALIHVSILCCHRLLSGCPGWLQIESWQNNLRNLTILSISLLDKTPIREVLTRCDYNNVKEPENKQLIISGF